MARQNKARVLNIKEFKDVEKMITLTRHAKRNLAILYLSFGAGLRACEIRRLRLEDIIDINNELRSIVTLTRTKGDKKRNIYLSNKKLRTVLMDHIEEMKSRCSRKRIPLYPHSPVFMSQKGGQFTPSKIVSLICGFFKAARIEGAKSHSGRRTFITTKIDEGIDFKAIADIVGHTNIGTTMGYHESNPNRLLKISEKNIF